MRPVSLLRPIGVTLVATCAICALAAVHVAHAAPQPAAPATPTRDSLRLARAAHDAQASFERARRANLPIDWGGGSGGRCDARVGRLCYWIEDDDADTTRPADPPRVVAARATLLAALDSVARAIPGDGWVAGQRVRYWSEAGVLGRALDAARDCQAAPGWCGALAGYALHVAGRYAAAESAYVDAIAAMDSTERCRWLDITPLLDGPPADRYRQLDCARRSALAERFWTVATPLYLLGANDLRTERWARLTRVRLEADAKSPRDMSWGDDLEELTVRYGWSTWFTKRPAPIGSVMSPESIVGHDPSPALALLPTAAAVDTPWHAAPDAWESDERPGRMRYAPAYARTFRPVPHQLARFPRGDSTLVVLAYDVAADTAFHRDALIAALSVIDSAGGRHTIRLDDAPRHAVLEGGMSSGTSLVSVELLDSASRVAGRTRYGLPALVHGDIALSDLLLFTPRDSLPRTVEEAAANARASTTLRRDQRVGVFWEMRGIPVDTALTLSLAIEPDGPDGISRRAAQWLHLRGERAPMRIGWRRPATPSEVVAEAIVLDLARLEPGRYVLRLLIASPDGAQAVSERRIEVRR